MAIPKKAFILYCPCQPDQLIPNVNLVTLKGCSGQIVLEKEEDKEDDTTILQLLGLYPQKNLLKSNFKERFHDMSLAVISNHKSTKEITQQLGCFHENIDSIDQIKKVLNDEFNIVLVDFTGYSDPWKYINELIKNKDKNIIQCIISSYRPSSSLSSRVQHTTTFLPRQSYLMKNGFEVTTNPNLELMYSYLHAGSARTDLATTFNLQEIKHNGSNGKILAWHFLAEIGNKLGFVPKYGA